MAAGRLDILAAILAGLQGITIAGGYLSDVLQVEKLLKSWDDVPESKKPWIGFAPRLSATSTSPTT